jgi:hypothetical protein
MGYTRSDPTEFLRYPDQIKNNVDLTLTRSDTYGHNSLALYAESASRLEAGNLPPPRPGQRVIWSVTFSCRAGAPSTEARCASHMVPRGTVKKGCTFKLRCRVTVDDPEHVQVSQCVSPLFCVGWQC